MHIVKSSELLKNTAHPFFDTAEPENIESAAKIIEDVKNNGDSAIIKYSKNFGDGDFANSNDFLVTDKEVDEAFNLTSNETIKALETCKNNITNFAQEQFKCIKNLDLEIDGSYLGHKIIPLEKVLCYVPGGNYPLPSSALMTTIPAKIAGVKNIALTSPKIKAQTIVAAKLGGADKIYRLGGIQAISAFAYGSESISAVDKIVGPGNKYVTFAKKYVYGKCAIDFLAGPSEVLIVADDNQDPKLVSADILAQCEHDKDARGYLICFSEDFALKVIKEAKKQLENLETKEIARISFEKSIAIIAENLSEAAEISNKRAPEHLELMFENAQNLSNNFINYGSLFIGAHCAEVFGDYCSGTNHVLPTNSASRYTGGLSVFDFIKIQTYQMLSKNYACELSKSASQIAKQEGLFAHKLASDLRRENEI